MTLMTPGGAQAAEESRRLAEGEIAEAGAVQVVMTHAEWWFFQRQVAGRQQEVYLIPAGRPDLPTYGIRYTRRFT